jgi:hypothetical protein
MKDLITSLIVKKAIIQDSEIEVKSDAGTKKLFIKQINRTFFNCIDIKDGKPLNCDFRNIVKIDGMRLDRIAKLYNVNLDGSFIPKGKKRGRKAKNKD